jgi:hypothetical protein
MAETLTCAGIICGKRVLGEPMCAEEPPCEVSTYGTTEERLSERCFSIAARLLSGCEGQMFGYKMQASIDTAIKLIHVGMQLKPCRPTSPLGD